MVAAAVIGSAVVGAGVSAYGAKKSAAAQGKAAKNSNATQLYMYDQTRADQAPYMQAGTASLSQLAQLMGAGGSAMPSLRSYSEVRSELKADPPKGGWNNRRLEAAIQEKMKLERGALRTWQASQEQMKALNPEYGSLTREFEFEKDPGYDWRMQQGQEAVEASAAARGGALGGRALKELTRYGQGFASNEYQNAYNRFNTDQTNRFNRLATLAGVGQTSSNVLANANANTGNQLGSNALQAGNAQAAGIVGSTNALASGANTLGNWWMQQNAMNSARQPAPVTAVPSTTYSGSASAANYG